MLAPIPFDAPVTTATFPSSFFVMAFAPSWDCPCGPIAAPGRRTRSTRRFACRAGRRRKPLHVFQMARGLRKMRPGRRRSAAGGRGRREARVLLYGLGMSSTSAVARFRAAVKDERPLQVVGCIYAY